METKAQKTEQSVTRLGSAKTAFFIFFIFAMKGILK